MTEGLIKHTQRRVCSERCRVPLLWIQMLTRLARPRSLLTGTWKGFLWLDDAVWGSWDWSSCVEHMNHTRPPETGGDSPAPLQCRGNIFQEDVEPPQLPSKPGTGFSVLPHTFQISALPDCKDSSPRLWEIYWPQYWAACRQLSLQGGLPWHQCDTPNYSQLPHPNQHALCKCSVCPRWIWPAGWDTEAPREDTVL